MTEVTPTRKTTRPAASIAPVIWTINQMIDDSKSCRASIYKAIKNGSLVTYKRGSRTIAYDEDYAAYVGD